MQSRRMVSDEAKQGLEQAMRRVATIALVHETLSQGLTQSVDFDELIGRQFRLSAEVASPSQAGPHRAQRRVRRAAERLRHPVGPGHQ